MAFVKMILPLQELGLRRSVHFSRFRFCGYQKNPRPVVSRTDHQKANAQDGFLNCVEQKTTGLQRWRRPRIHVSYEMRLRAFLCGLSIGLC